MSVPDPDSLINFVKPSLITSEIFLGKLTEAMSDEDIVKDSYRGAGVFIFYIEGYMNTTAIIETRNVLIKAGYQVHRIEQQAGYIPPAWWHDTKSAGHEDPGVTGTSQTPWFIVSVSKAKVDPV